MQSHLTRRVFRAIVNNEPFRFSQCRGRLPASISCPRPRNVFLNDLRHVQARGLFSFPVAAEPETTQVITPEVGLKPMSDLMRALQTKSRTPPYEILCKAFNDFFTARVDTPGVITDFHGSHLVATWRHLRDYRGESDHLQWEDVSSRESLETVLYVLSEADCLPESHGAVRQMARLAYCELSASNETESNISRQALLAYIRIMAFNGNASEAHRVTTLSWKKLRRSKPSPWLWVMQGLAMENDRPNLYELVETSEKYGYTLDPASQEELTMTLLRQNMIEAAKTIYGCPLPRGTEQTLATKIAVIKASIMEGDLTWAKSVVLTLPSTPSAETRNIYLLWEAANGSGAAALEEILDRWSLNDPGLRQSLSISCVNDLIRYAYTIGNPQLAADFAALVQKWELEPDFETHTLLSLESRVQASDTEGILESLRELEEMDALHHISLPLTNKLIKNLCQSDLHDAAFEEISALLDPLVENSVRLEPDTLAALTRMLLRRHDWEAISQLLRPRLGSYASEERSLVLKTIVNFIKDANQTDDDVWEAYNLLKVAFPETVEKTRTSIMEVFFDRNRVDRACVVFGHMRQAASYLQRPKSETYIQCFRGIARAADAENLELVRNMLKLDLEVELTTRVRNALMLALAACEQPDEAMEIFRDILRSEEGPSSTTIAIFFRACATHPTGTVEAAKMMDKVRLLEIPVDRPMYTEYIKAFAAQGDHESAIEALDKMQSEIGEVTDIATYVVSSFCFPPYHFQSG